ncbi:hypothetical protein CN275_20890 [Bacillus anthracis]|nr:hypothetical protein CN275_20890 [Bacillus anthracis]PFR12193.1 hypothetical protein COK10_07900 [Bacillus anthracis]PGZ32473.1 hypothetical protein COE50_12930 [Bacillus anthracis]
MLKTVGKTLITISLSASLLVACSSQKETATQPQQQDPSKPVEKSEPQKTENVTAKEETTQSKEQDQPKPTQKSEPQETSSITTKEETMHSQKQDQPKPTQKSEPQETGSITAKEETTQSQKQDQSNPAQKSEPSETGSIATKKEPTQSQKQDQPKPAQKSEPQETGSITTKEETNIISDTDARKLIAKFLGMNPAEAINIKNYGKTKDEKEGYTARNNPEFVGHTGGTMLIGWFAIDPKTKEVTEIEPTDMK